jgi:uncharacterized protein YjbJ (UPF0337 family)
MNSTERRLSGQIIGSVKQTVGKALGDPKLRQDGKADVLKGKVRSTVGGIKDLIREA